jgi:TRAP-type C4-dicarboxylate transport system substrate-binding protein
MKKVGSILVVSILMLCLMLTGCSQKTAPATGDGASAGDQAADKTYELNFCYFGPEVVPPGHWSAEAAKRIEEKTNGKVKIKNYYTESLLKYNDVITGTASGVTDIGFVDGGCLNGASLSLNCIFQRYIAAAPSQEASTKAFRELINTIPELNEELAKKNLRWVSIMSLPGEHLHTVKKEVRVPADIVGMKVNCVGEIADWFKCMGAAPVQGTTAVFYMNLERGVVEAIWSFWGMMEGFKLYEVTNYHTVFGTNGSNLGVMGFLVNLDTWNSLPKEYQDVIVEAYDWAGDNIIVAMAAEEKAAIESATKKGSTFVNLTPEELKLLADTMAPVNKAWIKATEAKGLPAQKTFDKLMELIDKYNK